MAIAVALLPYGAGGSAHRYGYQRSGCAALVALAQNASQMRGDHVGVREGVARGERGEAARPGGSAPAANAAAVPGKLRRDASGARFAPRGAPPPSAASHRIDFRAGKRRHRAA